MSCIANWFDACTAETTYSSTYKTFAPSSEKHDDPNFSANSFETLYENDWNVYASNVVAEHCDIYHPLILLIYLKITFSFL